MSARLDVNDPNSANTIGVDLAQSTQQLATQMQAQDVSVRDMLGLEQAAEDRRRIGDAVKAVQVFFEPIKRMADQLHKAIVAREKSMTGPLLALDTLKKDAIKRFNESQAELRRQEEQRIAEARRRDEQQRAAEEAAALELSGEPELAAMTLQSAIEAPMPVVALVDQTRQLVSFTRRWYWRYAGGPKDVKATPPAVRDAALKLIPPAYLIVDEKKVGAYARAMKSSGAIPGVEIYYVDEPNR